MALKFKEIYRVQDGLSQGFYQAVDHNFSFNHGVIKHPGLKQDHVLQMNIEKFLNGNPEKTEKYIKPGYEILLPHDADDLEMGNWFFGFKSLEQYKAWFFTPEIRDMLKKHNFNLVKIKASLTIPSKTQLIFFAPGSEVLEVLDPTFVDS